MKGNKKKGMPRRCCLRFLQLHCCKSVGSVAVLQRDDTHGYTCQTWPCTAAKMAAQVVTAVRQVGFFLPAKPKGSQGQCRGKKGEKKSKQTRGSTNPVKGHRLPNQHDWAAVKKWWIGVWREVWRLQRLHKTEKMESNLSWVKQTSNDSVKTFRSNVVSTNLKPWGFDLETKALKGENLKPQRPLKSTTNAFSLVSAATIQQRPKIWMFKTV